MERKIVLLEKKEGVARITLNNPAKRNCLSEQMALELISAFEEARDDDTVRAVTTTGAGDVAYMAGLSTQDLAYSGEHPESEFEPTVFKLDEMIRNFPKVTIAVVNGYCLGGGVTFLVSHDLAIASLENAKFGLPEVMRDVPPKHVVAALFRAIPMKPAFELLLTADNWDAKKAQAAGLINRVVPHAKLQEAAFQWAKEIIRWDPLALEYCKKAAHASMDEATYAGAILANAYYFAENDRLHVKGRQGFRDFVAKRGVKATKMAE